MMTTGNQQPTRLSDDQWKNAVSECILQIARGVQSLKGEFLVLAQEVAERNTLVVEMNAGFPQYAADQKAERDAIIKSCADLRHGVEELMRQIKDDRAEDEPWKESLKDDWTE